MYKKIINNKSLIILNRIIINFIKKVKVNQIFNVLWIKMTKLNIKHIILFLIIYKIWKRDNNKLNIYNNNNNNK